MSDSMEGLKRQIDGAKELESVVRTMKALAASSIVQYEKAVISLNDYYRTVELALAVFFKSNSNTNISTRNLPRTSFINMVVFGSDQGLVGQFNDLMYEYVINSLKTIDVPVTIWTVGERIQSRLLDGGWPSKKNYDVPNSVSAITPLIGQILLDIQTSQNKENTSLLIFHHQQKNGGMYEPQKQLLLPIDQVWRQKQLQVNWPTSQLPQMISSSENSLLSLIDEYLFVSIFRACAESLASENASRMTSMQRAEKNINELLEDLNLSYHRQRQNSIDEELFDVVSGFESLKEE